MYFADSLARLQALQADGLVEVDADEIRVTGPGRLFLRNIAMAFDAYMHLPKKVIPG